jgi:hypothetical protein
MTSCKSYCPLHDHEMNIFNEASCTPHPHSSRFLKLSLALRSQMSRKNRSSRAPCKGD